MPLNHPAGQTADDFSPRGVRLHDIALRLTKLARMRALPLVLGGAVLAVSAVVLAAAPTLYVVDSWPDIFIPLEAAAHWQHGHAAHEDVRTQLGAAYLVFAGLAGWATGNSPYIVIVMNLAMGALCSGFAAIVCLRRFKTPLAVLVAAFCGLLALSPRELSGLAEHVNFLAPYNKWGFALLTAIWLAAAVPPRRNRPAPIETALAGAVLAFLFYMKLTYFVAGAAPFAVNALFYARGRKRITAALPVLIGTALILLCAAAFRISLTGYAADLLLAARASVGMGLIQLMFDLFRNVHFVLLALAAYLLHRRVTGTGNVEASRARTMMLMLIILSLAVNNQNTSIDIPILCIMPLILLIPEKGPRRLAQLRRINALFLMGPALFLLSTSARELEAIAIHYGEASRMSGLSFCKRTSLPICRMRVTDFNPARPVYRMTYAHMRPIFEELYGALDPLVAPDDRIFFFGFINPLNPRYGLRPPKGGLMFWHFERNVSVTHHPDPEEALHDVTVAVMPRRKLPNSPYPEMIDIYGPVVERDFAVAAETPNWRIYRRLQGP